MRASHAERCSTENEVREYYHRVLPFYDAELRDRGDDGFWTWAASEPAGCRVLEVGAGTGRATEFLARAAGLVVAFDLSLEMATAAQRRLVEQPKIAVLVGDLRDLRLATRFDLVAAVDDPFVHLIDDGDRDRAFATVAEHLAPGGRFLLDAAWLAPERRHAAEQGAFVEDRSAGGGLSVREVWRCQADTRLCTTRFEYRVGGRLAAKASFPARLWFVDELEDRSRTVGLEITRMWGDYDRRPWNRGTSPRLIAEMRRSADPAFTAPARAPATVSSGLRASEPSPSQPARAPG